MSPPFLGPPPDLLVGIENLGVIEICNLLACILFGVVTTQCYIYYSRFPEDSWKLKYTVLVVWTFNLGALICSLHVLYTFTVVFYGQPQRMVQPPRSMNVFSAFSSLVEFIVRTFFISRVYAFTRNRFIFGACSFISVGLFIEQMSIVVIEWRLESVALLAERYPALLIVASAGGTSIDWFISGVLIYYLMKSREEFPAATVNMVDSLIAFNIQTGLLTSVTALTQMICYLAMRDNLVWFAIFLLIPGMFANALLARLNARIKLRSMAQDVVHSTEVITSLNRNLPRPRFASTGTSRSDYLDPDDAVMMKTLRRSRDTFVTSADSHRISLNV